MRITILASVASFALIATIGSVSAADQFTTLRGVKAVPMSSAELNAVKGMDHHFFVTTPHDTPNTITATNGGVQISVLDPNASDSAGPLETDGRFGTDHHQDDLNGGNFQMIGGQLRAPSYNGLRLHACLNAVIGTAGCL